MSRYYTFYPCYQKDGKIYPIIKTVSEKPASVFWRSGSFIDEEFFKRFPMIEGRDMDDSLVDYFTAGKGYETDENTYKYLITEDSLEKYMGDGLVAGYVPVETAKMFADKEYKSEFLQFEKDSLLPAEIVAEMQPAEREKYVLIYGIDYFNKEWICSHLYEILDDLYLPFDIKGEKCYVMNFSF